MILVVTGTGTGVGKTMVSATLCAAGLGHSEMGTAGGARVAYLKVAQTGVPGDVPDIDTVGALVGTGVTLAEGARYPDPMSPEAAARAAGWPSVELSEVAATAINLHREHELLVVEGAGGLLVRMGPNGWTLADLAGSLGAELVLATGSGLGTLNSTALTLEAIATRGLTCAAVVVTPWPVDPDRLQRSNVVDLTVLAGRTPLLLPELNADDISATSQAVFGALLADQLAR